MNKEKINSALSILSFIPLSIAVFGILTLGAFVAPVIFGNLSPRPLAAEIMTNIFQRFYPFAFVCTLISLGMELIRIPFLGKAFLKSKLLLVQFFCVVIVAFMMGYSSIYILPEIDEMRIENKGPALWENNEFAALHKTSESLAKGIFFLGLIPLGIMIVFKPKLQG